MRKILFALAGIALLFFGGRMLLDALASDETKIRRMVADAAEAYNGASARGVVAPLVDDWRDGNSGLDRDTLRLILARTFLTDRDSKTRELLTRVSVDDATVVIELDEADPDRGRVAALARFERRRAGTWEESWVVQIEADLRRIDGDWRVVDTERVSKRGRQP